jgi:hypothetical protein
MWESPNRPALPRPTWSRQGALGGAWGGNMQKVGVRQGEAGPEVEIKLTREISRGTAYGGRHGGLEPCHSRSTCSLAWDTNENIHGCEILVEDEFVPTWLTQGPSAANDATRLLSRRPAFWILDWACVASLCRGLANCLILVRANAPLLQTGTAEKPGSFVRSSFRDTARTVASNRSQRQPCTPHSCLLCNGHTLSNMLFSGLE